MQKDEYDCRKCINKGSKLCELCTTTISPSGKTSKPTLYRESSENTLRIRIQTVPPLGVTPRYIHDERRAEELAAAIIRYADCGLPIPTDWVAEYNELRTRNKPRV